MARASAADGIPFLAIVWAHYNIVDKSDMSGWPMTIMCPKEVWASYAEDIVSHVVERPVWFVQKLPASGQPTLGPGAEQANTPSHTPKRHGQLKALQKSIHWRCA